MELTLTVTQHGRSPAARQRSAGFGHEGGTIGRATDNDLVLEDPERYVSSRHAQIRYRDDRYYLVDTSTNGTYVNGASEPAPNGKEVALADGDVLLVGDYQLTVAIRQTSAAAWERASDDGEPTSEPSGPRIPWDTQSTASPRVGPEYNGSEQEPAPNIIPEDFDWSQFDGSEDTGETEAPPGPMPDHAPAYEQHYSPPRPVPRHRSVSDHERASEPSEPPVPSQMQPEPNAGAQPSTSACWDGLLAGLGVAGQANVPAGQEAQLAETAGEMLRTATRGLIDVLRARSGFKSQLRLEMTRIEASGNNPLKFSIDETDALKHLLWPSRAGFLGPVEATQEALEDIQAHEMAMAAGLQAALTGLLERFDPDRLESQFERHSRLGHLIPTARKARCWELFEEVYQDVARDAQEGFLHLFTEEFNRAYEAQMQELKKARNHHDT